MDSAGPARTSLARCSGSHWPLHRKPARSAKEVPDLSWRKACPGCAFYRVSCPGRPARSSPPPGARGLTWRGVSASHPRPGTCESRTNPNLPRLTHPRLGAGGGSGVSGDSHKVSPPRDAQAPGRARCAGPGAGLRQVLPATHLGEEAVHCSGARTFFPGGAEVSAARRGAAAGPGKPRVSRRASGRLQPAEPPRCHPPVAAAPPHLLSASRTSSVPTAAFVSSSSKFLTSGRSAPGRRTAVGTFFPGWGRAARGWRRACLPLRSAGGARSEPGTADHQRANNGEHSGPRRSRLSPAPALANPRAPPAPPRPAPEPRLHEYGHAYSGTAPAPSTCRGRGSGLKYSQTPPIRVLATPIIAPPTAFSGFPHAAPTPSYQPTTPTGCPITPPRAPPSALLVCSGREGPSFPPRPLLNPWLPCASPGSSCHLPRRR